MQRVEVRLQGVGAGDGEDDLERVLSGGGSGRHSGESASRHWWRWPECSRSRTARDICPLRAPGSTRLPRVHSRLGSPWPRPLEARLRSPSSGACYARRERCWEKSTGVTTASCSRLSDIKRCQSRRAHRSCSAASVTANASATKRASSGRGTTCRRRTRSSARSRVLARDCERHCRLSSVEICRVGDTVRDTVWLIVPTAYDEQAMASLHRRPWTQDEIRREERAQRERVRRDAARGVSRNLSDAVAHTRFAQKFADAFKHARSR